MRHGWWFAPAVVAASLGCHAWAGAPAPETHVAAAGADPGLNEPRLLTPTLGRPVFVEPGGKMVVSAQMPGAGDQCVFELAWPHASGQRYRLIAGENAAGQLAKGRPVALTVPPTVPARTYDLDIRYGEDRLLGRHCVAVGAVPERVRIVHLSNMNVGDVGAPDFDRRLVDEVNLVAPTVIVATGDLLDATHENPRAAWERAADFFSLFDAPAIIACGDHDDLGLYCRHVAPSPIGAVEVGPYRGVVLFDLPGRSIADDPEQVRWVEQSLSVPGDERTTFVVSHDESPNLLREWQRRHVLSEMVRATRLGVWFSGGHRDWDGVEYQELIAAAAPMLYVRTHEASTATCEGAGGVGHYRMVDLVGDRAVAPGVASESAGLPASIGVGQLNLHVDGRNDGSQERVALTAVNNLPFRMDGLSARVLLKMTDGQQPWCVGAELEQAYELGRMWECRVRFALPDKGALRAVIGTGPEPSVPDVSVQFDAPLRLELAWQSGSEGLSYLVATGAPVLVHLQNLGAQVADVTPVVRLDGETLAYVVLDEPGPSAAAYRLRIAPGRTLTLQVDLSAIRVAAGRRELEVYLRGPVAWRPACFPLEVAIAPE